MEIGSAHTYGCNKKKETRQETAMRSLSAVVCRQNPVRQEIQATNAGAGMDPYAINANP